MQVNQFGAVSPNTTNRLKVKQTNSNNQRQENPKQEKNRKKSKQNNSGDSTHTDTLV